MIKIDYHADINLLYSYRSKLNLIMLIDKWISASITERFHWLTFFGPYHELVAPLFERQTQEQSAVKLSRYSDQLIAEATAQIASLQPDIKPKQSDKATDLKTLKVAVDGTIGLLDDIQRLEFSSPKRSERMM